MRGESKSALEDMVMGMTSPVDPIMEPRDPRGPGSWGARAVLVVAVEEVAGDVEVA